MHIYMNLLYIYCINASVLLYTVQYTKAESFCFIYVCECVHGVYGVYVLCI